MNTHNVSADMMEALKAMAHHGARSPSTTGLSVRTFRALQERGLVETANGRDFELTEDGRLYLFDKV